MRSNIFIVMAAYNEEDTILQTIKNLLILNHKIIVIDDCSSDKTKDIIKGLNVHFIENQINLGYDLSITKGINQAFIEGAENVVTCDADGQHRAVDVQRLIEIISSPKVDFVSGIRNKCNRKIERLIGFFSYYIYGNKDPFCGLKAYSRNFYNCFTSFPISLNVGTLPIEIVKKNNLTYKYLNISVEDRPNKSRFGNSFTTDIVLLKSFLKTLFMKY